MRSPLPMSEMSCAIVSCEAMNGPLSSWRIVLHPETLGSRDPGHNVFGRRRENLTEHRRGRRHIKDPMRLRAPLLFQLRTLSAERGVGGGLFKIALLIKDMGRELFPVGFLRLSKTRKLIHPFTQATAQRNIAELHSIHRYDRKFFWQAVLQEIEQRRHQLAPGEITCAAEDDKYRGLEFVRRF